jgi:septum formation protein
MLMTLIEQLERLDIILASASPRRYELLKGLGLNFKVIPSDAPEDHILLSDFEGVVKKNALSKGMAVAQKHPDALVISADTIVVLGNRIMGKPKTEQEAFEMLQALNGETHRVYTGIGLFFQRYERSALDAVCTKVRFRQLSEEEIWAYIGTGEPFDKAGGYGIQGQGALLVDGIDGCFFNVVGLPLSRLFTMLTEFMKHFVI